MALFYLMMAQMVIITLPRALECCERVRLGAGPTVRRSADPEPGAAVDMTRPRSAPGRRGAGVPRCDIPFRGRAGGHVATCPASPARRARPRRSSVARARANRRSPCSHCGSMTPIGEKSPSMAVDGAQDDAARSAAPRVLRTAAGVVVLGDDCRQSAVRRPRCLR